MEEENILNHKSDASKTADPVQCDPPSLPLRVSKKERRRRINEMKALMKVSHDSFFFFLFKMRMFAIAFFQRVLPPELLDSIDLSQLEVSETIFLTSSYKRKIPDVLFRVPVL